MICQHFYWPKIRDAVCKGVINYDNFQLTNRSNIIYGKLPAKLYAAIPWNKTRVDLIGTYVISKKGRKKIINLKTVKIIDPVTGCTEEAQNDDKRSISIAKLVETTWLSIYPRPIEIMYDQGLEFIGHKFRKYLIEE